MLVDDDPNIRKLAKMSLERVGSWRVLAVASGQEALELLKDESPDVIILDVMMPGLDGRATLARIKESESASVPVILMTAKVQTGELDEYIRIGACGVIIKPFDPLKLPGEIKALLADCET
jgi:two-component system OmpR family response regulator